MLNQLGPHVHLQNTLNCFIKMKAFYHIMAVSVFPAKE